ncbi:MAG: hypothetical protein AAF559_13520 [Pseudomonadota bacterium]
MAYKSSRGVAWIDRATKRLTQTPDGADRLSRWLVVAFTILMLSVSYMGLAMAVTGSDRGSFLALMGLLGVFAIWLGFHRHIHFGGGTDERERLVAWKSFGVSSALVGFALIAWMMANGALENARLWVPESKDQWRALGLVSIASLHGFASIAIALMQPPYLPEPGEDFPL